VPESETEHRPGTRRHLYATRRRSSYNASRVLDASPGADPVPVVIRQQSQPAAPFQTDTDHIPDTSQSSGGSSESQSLPVLGLTQPWPLLPTHASCVRVPHAAGVRVAEKPFCHLYSAT
jgi:hypothetical protein